MPRVLVTSTHFRRASGDHERRLLDAGCDVSYGPYARPASEDELLALLGGVDAVIAGTDAFTRRALAGAPQLKVVSRFGVGYDAIDVAAAAELGIWVTNTPGTNEHSVADAALAMVLLLARRFLSAVESTRAGKWDRPIGLELRGLTLGLVGFGRIGRQVALRARAFGLHVLVHDVFQDQAAAQELGCRFVALDHLLRESDFVSLHAPATPETHNLIGRETLALMKRDAYLINTARGELVDEDALHEALSEGRLAGAALDVFKHEPPGEDHPLLALPNVIALPHIAGISLQANRMMAALSADNVLAVLRGERPPHPVNAPAARR
ncbi:MAG TPA: phosphoglycerate dehydrogenase [Chloroflexota bacterium]|nr:phosphoglycerate dehydrogenase [Chloroflexota bacterium]